MIYREGTEQDPRGISRWMISALGFDSWLEFCKKFGGQKWWIPTGPTVQDRNNQIREDFQNIMESGYEPRMEAVFDGLAEKYGVSKRWIRKIIYPANESEQNFLESSHEPGGLSH